MTKEFEDRGNTYTIHESKDIGEVRVADEVLSLIHISEPTRRS